VRRVRIGDEGHAADAAAALADVAEHRADVVARHRRHQVGPPDLAELGDNKVRVERADDDAVRRELGPERGGEVMDERLGAGVDAQQRRRRPARRRRHVEDEAAFARDHAGRDELGHAHKGDVVERYDRQRLLLGREVEVLGVAVRLADVVDCAVSECGCADEPRTPTVLSCNAAASALYSASVAAAKSRR